MKLSVAIPTYNDLIFDNNLKQLFKEYDNNFEIIIQNNASTDNTEEVVEKYIKLGCQLYMKETQQTLVGQKL